MNSLFGTTVARTLALTLVLVFNGLAWTTGITEAPLHDVKRWLEDR